MADDSLLDVIALVAGILEDAGALGVEADLDRLAKEADV